MPSRVWFDFLGGLLEDQGTIACKLIGTTGEILDRMAQAAGGQSVGEPVDKVLGKDLARSFAHVAIEFEQQRFVGFASFQQGEKIIVLADQQHFLDADIIASPNLADECPCLFLFGFRKASAGYEKTCDLNQHCLESGSVKLYIRIAEREGKGVRARLSQCNLHDTNKSIIPPMYGPWHDGYRLSQGRMQDKLRHLDGLAHTAIIAAHGDNARGRRVRH